MDAISPVEKTISLKKVPVEVYSRVVGYFRPVNQWNKGKQEEFKERHEFDAKEIVREFETLGQNIDVFV